MKSEKISNAPYRSLETEFRQGMRSFELDDYESALKAFQRVQRLVEPGDPRANLYSAYCGLTRVYQGQPAGLAMCRQAAAYERDYADVLHNLARAERYFGHRREAIAAMQRGLKIDSRHRGLLRLQAVMGARRRPALPFFSREHFLNRWLGKLTYRLSGRPVLVQHATVG